MEHKYKRLGDYIRQIDIRNKELAINKLLGVSISKKFIPSIANTVGTDLSNYKIVRTGQFAYGPVTSRNGDKISIAYLTESDCIISSSYTVFEVTKPSELNPEYLMLWFSRPEFDRYARFMSHGSVREIFDWEEFCRIEFPLPSIEEQNEIVKGYNTITNRIELKQKINDNLFEQGKTLLRHLYDNAELFGEITNLDSYCSNVVSGGTPSRTVDQFWNSNDVAWLKNGEIKNNIILSTEEYISEAGLKGSSAKLVPIYSVNMAMYCVSEIQVSLSCIPLATNQAVLNFSTESFRKSCFVYYLLATYGNEITSQANGSAQQNLSKEKIISYEFPCPNLDDVAFDFLEINIQERIRIAKELVCLAEMKVALLSRLSN